MRIYRRGANISGASTRRQAEPAVILPTLAHQVDVRLAPDCTTAGAATLGSGTVACFLPLVMPSPPLMAVEAQTLEL